MFKKLQLYSVIIVIVCMFGACGTPKNFTHFVYLQDSVTEAEKNISDSAAVIMPGDRLSIPITAINQEAAQAFNIGGTASNTSSTTGSTGGYLVDSSGTVELLQLGAIQARGLTTNQLADTVKQKLLSYLKGPVVTVNIVNFKINMLGEINRPGVLMVPDGKINILEAISQAGDLTLYGRRDNILIIRTVNGKREFGRIDVSSNKVFESPYFNLKQNDFVYIEPDKSKFISNDVYTARLIRNFGFGLTILSSILILINVTKK